MNFIYHLYLTHYHTTYLLNI